MRCPTCNNQNQRICGYGGNPNSDFVILGESPGVEELEDAQPRPFVGKTGEKLERAFSKAPGNMKFGSCFHINAVNCDINDIEDSTGKIGVATYCAFQCRDRLIDDICRRRRKFILALGSAPLRALYNNKNLKMTDYEGSVECFKFRGQKNRTYVLFSSHPRYSRSKYVACVRTAIVLHRILKRASMQQYFSRKRRIIIGHSTSNLRTVKLPNLRFNMRSNIYGQIIRKLAHMKPIRIK